MARTCVGALRDFAVPICTMLAEQLKGATLRLNTSAETWQRQGSLGCNMQQDTILAVHVLTPVSGFERLTPSATIPLLCTSVRLLADNGNTAVYPHKDVCLEQLHSRQRSSFKRRLRVLCLFCSALSPWVLCLQQGESMWPCYTAHVSSRAGANEVTISQRQRRPLVRSTRQNSPTAAFATRHTRKRQDVGAMKHLGQKSEL